MNSANNMLLDMDRGKLHRLQMEYRRANPYNLPELRKRPRIREKSVYEKVFSTRQ